jgi:RNA polymerase sigma factor (sigma-70 family)
MSLARLPLDEEQQLVERILRGDQDALSEFYEQYERLIYGTIRKFDFYAFDEGDDYFNGFYVKLIEDDWRRLRAWRGDSRLSTYLCTILKNYLKDERRKKAPDPASPDTIDEISEDPFEEIEAEMDLITLRAHMKDCAEKLSDRDQEIFNRHFIKDEKTDDIADALGVNTNTYYRAVHNTKNRLINCLKKDYPFLFSEAVEDG